MKIRVIATSVVASVAVIGAVLVPLLLRGGQQGNVSEELNYTVAEAGEQQASRTAYSRISSYSAFSDITLETEKRIIPYYESFSEASSSTAQPTAGGEDKPEISSAEAPSQSFDSEQTSASQPQTTQQTVVSEISLLRLVNKNNPLPREFVPQTAKMDGRYVGRVIYPHLKEMLDDARKEGVNMFIRSGYRSYASQEAVLNDYIKQYQNQGYSYEKARQLALRWAALPGCSEHQSGLAVDINATGGTRSSTAYAWLAENAYRYGFILRYPADKEGVTGTSYEPWHYRYVGIGEAEKIKNSGLCLEEYLGG